MVSGCWHCVRLLSVLVDQANRDYGPPPPIPPPPALDAYSSYRGLDMAYAVCYCMWNLFVWIFVYASLDWLFILWPGQHCVKVMFCLWQYLQYTSLFSFWQIIIFTACCLVSFSSCMSVIFTYLCCTGLLSLNGFPLNFIACFVTVWFEYSHLISSCLYGPITICTLSSGCLLSSHWPCTCFSTKGFNLMCSFSITIVAGFCEVVGQKSGQHAAQ